MEPHPARPGTGQDRCLRRVDGQPGAARRRIRPRRAPAREPRTRPRHEHLAADLHAALPPANSCGKGLDGPDADRLGWRSCRFARQPLRSGVRAGHEPVAPHRPSADHAEMPNGAWTGSQMIVFGSSIGASYEPHTNTWQRLPPSTLAPEASSVGWIGRRLVAWDYQGDTQDYSPTANRWSATSQNPFGFGECYPQSVATATSMFAWFCGKAATIGPRAGSWALASGGVTAPTVHYGGTRLKQFQTASLAPAGAVIALAATGIVVNHGGPCFGCKGSTVTYWV